MFAWHWQRGDHKSARADPECTRGWPEVLCEYHILLCRRFQHLQSLRPIGVVRLVPNGHQHCMFLAHRENPVLHTVSQRRPQWDWVPFTHRTSLQLNLPFTGISLSRDIPVLLGGPFLSEHLYPTPHSGVLLLGAPMLRHEFRNEKSSGAVRTFRHFWPWNPQRRLAGHIPRRVIPPASM